MRKHYVEISLFLILLLAAFLRLYHIGFHEVWYDEARSIATAQKSFSPYSFYLYFGYKPLYFLTLKLWIYLWGVGAAKLRLLSVIFGIIGVFLTYKVGEVADGKRLGLISAFLISISCFHIYHSQQIRQFTFIVALSTASYYCFFKIITEPRKKFFIYNVIFNTAIVFTHPYGLAIVITQSLSALFVFGIKISRRWFFYNIGSYLGIIVWFFFSDKADILRSTWWIAKPGMRNILETIRTFIYGGPRYGLDDFWIKHNPVVANTLFLIFLLLIALGIVRLMRKNRKILYALLLWLIVPIGISWFFSIIFFPVFLIKHLIISLPPFLILSGSGLMYLRKRIYIVSALFLLIFLMMPSFIILYTMDYNIAWGKATVYLKEHIEPHDTIVIAPVCQLSSFLYYFRENKKGILKDIDTYGKIKDGLSLQCFKERSYNIIGINQTQGRTKNFFLNDTQTKLKLTRVGNSRSIWMLIDRWMGDSEKMVITSILSSRNNLTFRKKFRGVELYRFDQRETK